MFIVVLLTGCAKLQHLDQLLTLKGLSDEQTQMGQEIERQDARFERLAAAVEEGSISEYKDQKSVAGQFGPPIFTEKVQEDGRPIEVWVYRYAARFFDSPKVYLYWDQSGQLARWMTPHQRDKFCSLVVHLHSNLCHYRFVNCVLIEGGKEDGKIKQEAASKI